MEPVVTLESMPLEAVMRPEAAMAAEATVRPTEAVPTATPVPTATAVPTTAPTATAPVRVRGHAADEEQCCDQCGQPN